MERWVIVGAGSAGCVLANRLSADPDRHVTLLDDGPGLAPGSVPAAIDGADFLDALAVPGRTHGDLFATRSSGALPAAYLRGRGVGGSSAVNAMIALRGSDEQYRAWGWDDTDVAWQQVQIPAEHATESELGSIDRALLAASPAAERVDLTRRAGRRITAAEAYLWPMLDRPNLVISDSTAVDRVSRTGTQIIGVHLDDGTHLDADHVVLAAGAIHTPALLLRSGITGQGVGVDVGQHLQDHPAAAFTLQLHDAARSESGTLIVGTILHERIGDDLVQFMPMNHLGRQAGNERLGQLMVALMTPSGADGSVTIDGDGRPVVDFALLHDDHDLTALAAGARRARELLSQPGFADIVEAVYIDDVGTTADALDDDDALHAWLRSRGGGYVHASSSCAMGRVVDEHYAVIGVEGLSICDASIFPSIPHTNTHLPTTMAAERFCLRETMRA